MSTSGRETPYNPRPAAQRNATGPSIMERSETNQTAGTSDTQRLERKQQQLADVENEYFKLNPWYNQQKDKPVFGLDQPLPHTMRRGMWWGKSDLKKKMEDLKAEEQDLQEGIAKRDGLDFTKEKGGYMAHIANNSASTSEHC
jgi:aquaglyceroporin related protein